MRNLDKTWMRLHNQAICHPQSDNEAAIVHLYNAITCLDRLYRERYYSTIGEDGVIGPHYEELLKTFRGFLNLDIGRLDAGSLDSFAIDMARRNGLEIE